MLSKVFIFIMLLIGIFIRVFSLEANADDIFDVEHARALERSRMPLSENNLWYLDRWGGISDAPTKNTLRIGSYKENTKTQKAMKYSRKKIKSIE